MSTGRMQKEQVRVHIRWMIRRDMPEVLQIEQERFDYSWTEEDFLRRAPAVNDSVRSGNEGSERSKTLGVCCSAKPIDASYIVLRNSAEASGPIPPTTPNQPAPGISDIVFRSPDPLRGSWRSFNSYLKKQQQPLL